MMRQPRIGWQRLLCAWILAWLATAPALAAPLPEAANLAADAVTMREKRLPMVVLFSRGNCPWCERLRREQLSGLSENPVPSVLLREVETDRKTPLTDFAGRATTHKDFARAYGAKLAPTLMFFGPDGRQLAEPIVGYRLSDFYGAYLDAAIEESRKRLTSETP